MSLYFKNTFKSELIKSSLFILISTIVCSILYIALCISDTYIKMKILTDNLDYILPIFIIAVILKNFSYLKNEKELESSFSLPITQRSIFNLKYIISIIEISIVYIVLLLITSHTYGFLELMSNPSIEIARNDIYSLSLFVKYIYCFFLLNFLLFFYCKGNTMIHGIYLIVIITVILTMIFLVLNLLNIFFNSNSYVKFYILPFSIFNILSSIINSYVFSVLIFNELQILILILLLFTVVSIIISILLFKSHYKIKLELQGEVYINKLIRITLFILSIICIISSSLMISNFRITISLVFCIQFIFYLMYSSFASRFKPTNLEWLIYFFLFVLSVVVGLIL